MNPIQSNSQSMSKDQNYNRKRQFQYSSHDKLRERSRDRDHDRERDRDRDRDRDRGRDRDRDDHYHNHYHYEHDDRYHRSSYPSYEERNNNRKYDCYILLPKNYYNYILKNFENLRNDLKNNIKDINNIQFDYNLPHFPDYIFRLTTHKIYSKGQAIRIISDYLFKEQKLIFKNMSYLKVSILIPDNVIGFIIGIEGKNINSIRDETGARIEVHPQNDSRKYRQIEIAGDPLSISKAAEKIYGITYKYVNFNNQQILNRSDNKDYRDNNNNNNNYRRRNNDYDYDHRRRYSSKSRSMSDDNNNRNNDNRNYRESSKRRDDDYNMKREERYHSYKRNDSMSRSESNDRRDRERSYSNDNNNNNNSNNNNNTNNNNNNNDMKLELNKKEDDDLNEIKNNNDSNNNSVSNININNNPTNNNPINNNNNNVINTNQINEFGQRLKQNLENGVKCSINVVLSKESVDLLKRYKENIWLTLENTYQCSVSKKVEKLDDKDVSIITFNGAPEQNTLALYHLQKYLIDSSKNEK